LEPSWRALRCCPIISQLTISPGRCNHFPGRRISPATSPGRRSVFRAGTCCFQPVFAPCLLFCSLDWWADPETSSRAR
jgi:hypothetical protein